MDIVRLGPKQKHLALPPGWIRVKNHDICEEGDQFANVGNPNNPFWQLAEDEDIGMPADSFDCLIRRPS